MTPLKLQRTFLGWLLPLVAVLATGPVVATDGLERVRDLEFIEKTVARHSIIAQTRGVRWRDTCQRLKARIRDCRDDSEYLDHVEALFAGLGDAQTGLVDLAVALRSRSRPGDRLSSAGLGLTVSDGRVIVTDVPASHPLVEKLAPGAVLVDFAGIPAWMVLERVARGLEERFAFTSRRSMWARLGSGILPFGDQESRPARFLLPAGEFVTVRLSRSLVEDQELGVGRLPAGLEWRDGAVFGVFRHPGGDPGKRLGYLRLTGDIDEETVKVVERGLKALRSTDALIFDVRGVGGTDHERALAIAGRFQRSEVELTDPMRVVPTGSWQYANALILIQDAGVAEAGETLVWALVENGRTVTVGEPTAGWSLLTRTFEVPSKKFRFRVGVDDRVGEGRSKLVWGEGLRPDIPCPSGLLFDSNPDLALAIAEDALAYHSHGADAHEIVRTFTHLFVRGDVDRMRRSIRGTTKTWKPDGLIGDYLTNLEWSVGAERQMLKDAGVLLPDYERAALRLQRWLPELRRNDRRDLARELTAVEPDPAEVRAQALAREILEDGAEREKGRWSELARDHGKTRAGKKALEIWSLWTTEARSW